MIKLTLDTNCLFDYFERQSGLIQNIIELQNMGRVEIAITTRVKADTYGVRQDSPIWQKIQGFPCITIPALGRYGVSYYDEDFYASEEDVELNDLIFSCIGKNIKNVKDVDHLIGHIRSSRDIFVTSDSDDFIKHRKCLEEKCAVKILTPEECLEHVRITQ